MQKTIHELGYSEQQLADIEEMLTSPGGLVIVMAGSGSGRTTTLRALADRFVARRAAPTKVAVSHPSMKDEEYAALFRQDIDVTVLWKLNSPRMVQTATSLVRAGRKVMAVAVAHHLAFFENLMTKEVPADVLWAPGFLSGVIKQRKVRTLCQSCSVPLALFDGKPPAMRDGTYRRLRAVVRPGVDDPKVAGPGCVACGDSGHAGLTLFAETIMPAPSLLKRLSVGAYDHAPLRPVGHQSIEAHAVDKLRQGIVAAEELDNHLGLTWAESQ